MGEGYGRPGIGIAVVVACLMLRIDVVVVLSMPEHDGHKLPLLCFLNTVGC